MNKCIFKSKAQECEQKDGMSTTVIDKTTLIIYFPRTPEVTAMIPSVSALHFLHSTSTTVNLDDKNTDFITEQGLLLSLNTPTPITYDDYTIQQCKIYNLVKFSSQGCKFSPC